MDGYEYELYSTTTTDPASEGFLAGIGIGMLLVILALIVVIVVAQWKIFTKAGKPGWASLIPIYNTLVMLQIVGRPLWWFFLLLIPIVNIIPAIIVTNDLSKSFGKDIAWTVGLIFLPIIFYPILGFGSSKYVGPCGAHIQARPNPVA